MQPVLYICLANCITLNRGRVVLWFLMEFRSSSHSVQTCFLKAAQSDGGGSEHMESTHRGVCFYA
jgi:hypothetical protein